MAKNLVYRQYAPPPELAEHVLFLWELRGPCDDAAPQLLVPDGCLGLMINCGGPLQERVDTLVLAELRRPYWSHATGFVDMLGARFTPGAAAAFLDVTPGEVVDSVVSGAALATGLARDIDRTVRSAEPRERIALLQRALVRQLRVSRSAVHPLVRQAVRALFAAGGSLEIDPLAARLGITRRHLERRFSAEVGIAPKMLARVLRFRRVLRAIDAASPDWAGVALNAGYSDQSHLIRDFKQFIGRPPRAWLALEDAFEAETRGGSTRSHSSNNRAA